MDIPKFPVRFPHFLRLLGVGNMRISKEQYYKDMAKALLKGYFRGLTEGKKQKRVERKEIKE